MFIHWVGKCYEKSGRDQSDFNDRYSQISQPAFQGIYINGRLYATNTSNANTYNTNAISYISCDPEDYVGNLQATDIVRIAASQQNSIILYSTRLNHCHSTDLLNIARTNGIFTTLDPILASDVLGNLTIATNGRQAEISPDQASYSISNGNQPGMPTNQGSARPRTAVAMIVLYTITGLITALFVLIIITGAIRAHRHPERYGPNVVGRPRRSRAKGIARAMLDTIPIVKFGEKEEPKQVDVEMSSKDESKVETASTNDSKNADGTDETGQLGCSICTEDFTKGQEVRVLPCNHKFHPDCVDPWLLNVSGTCPLCRIDLRPKEEQEENAETEAVGMPANRSRRTSIFDAIAPPLGHMPIRPDRAGRRDTITNLRSAAVGNREERIAALRQYRQQRRGREQNDVAEEERRSLSTRLRERFRIRTRRQGEEENVEGGEGSERPMPARSVSRNALRNSYAGPQN